MEGRTAERENDAVRYGQWTGIKEDQANVVYGAAPRPMPARLSVFNPIHDLAKAINCHISIRSAPDAGTTFSLSTSEA